MFQFVFEGVLFKLTITKPALPALLLQLPPRIAKRKPSESRFITRILIYLLRGKGPPLVRAFRHAQFTLSRKWL